MYFLTVTFPHFLFLFQNHIAIFKQTWYNATLRSNKEPRLPSSKEILSEKSFYHQYANFNQTWNKALLYQFFERKTHEPL
jgi:hypothetical protein